MSFFNHNDDDPERGSIIESAEVLGPVFTESVDSEAIEKLASSDAFKQLRKRADQLADERETA